MDVDGSGTYDRRRAQVRKAQKTHRERKATYVKALEIEVRELREQNSVLIQESVASQELIRQLREALTSRGFPLPTGRSVNDLPTESIAQSEKVVGTDASSLTRVTMSGTTFPNQRVQVCRSAESDITSPQSLEHDVSFGAIEFVLALEQPCIYHHRIPSPELLITGSLGGTGHCAMLSSPIMSRAPPFNLNPFRVGYPPDAEWSVPTAELDTLLQTSQKLGLDTELTPIQMWHCIGQHSKFGLLQPQHVQHLSGCFLPYIKCYGFGAVITQSEFAEILEAFFNTI